MNTAKSIQAASGEFHVDDSGEQDLVPVVCFHSLFLDNRQMDAFTEAAAGIFRVIRPEYRGQGRSCAANGDIVTVEQDAGEMAAVLDAMGITNAHFLSSSMGGDVGLRVAANRPDLVRSMVITGSSARAEPSDQLAEFRVWVDDVGERGFVDDVLDTTVKIMFGKTTLNDPNRVGIVQLWTDRIAALPTSLKPAMAGVIERSSVVAQLAYISVPCLVISGEECIARPPEWAKELADGLPNSELWMMSGVGHSPLLEVPEVVNPRILEFFSTH
jgi:pimeloyl-ACP methyl ester carboxylesterase